MALRFDPASIMAPGGIASGLDNLGAAVMNAMNRRAERKYALEAEQRRRAMQLEDQASERTYRTGEREAGERFTVGDREDRQKADVDRDEARRKEAWLGDQRKADTAFTEYMQSYSPEVEGGDVETTDAQGTKTRTKVKRPRTQQEIDDFIAKGDAMEATLGAQFGDVESRKQWTAFKTKLQAAKAAPKPEAPKPKPKFDPTAATAALLADPALQEISRQYDLPADGGQETLDAWRTLTTKGDSPKWDWLSAFQSQRTPAGTTRTRSEEGRRERGAAIYSRAKRYADQFAGDPAATAWLGQYAGGPGQEAADAGDLAGSRFALPNGEPIQIVQPPTVTAQPAAHKTDPRYLRLSPTAQRVMDDAIADGMAPEQALAVAGP
jgi:hypothetical protein